MRSNPMHRAITLATTLLLALVTALPAGAALIIDPPLPITHTVTVQPIVVSDDDGTNTATFFGTLSQQSDIEGLVDQVFAQAGIDIEFLAPNGWNSTFANEGTPGDNDPRPTSDLFDIVSDAATAGVNNADPNVINMYFSNIPAGFSALGASTVAGLAFVGGNGVSQYIGASLLGFGGGREVIASVVAHEIAHNLGLPHIHEAENLMQSSAQPNQGERLNDDQIATVLASNFAIANPPPPPSPAVEEVPLPLLALLVLSLLLGRAGWRETVCVQFPVRA